MPTPATPRLLLCAALLALALAAPAAASTVAYDGSVLNYTAAPGEQNSVLVTVNPYDSQCAPVAAPCLAIMDRARISFPAGKCALSYSDVFGDEVHCAMPDSIAADLGDGADAMWDWNGPSAIDAGSGDDNPIVGGGGNDVVYGGVGNDVVVGGAGDDVVAGGPGDDDLDGIPGGHEGADATLGADTYVGGPGGDSVTYEDRGEHLNLSPDGVADDGAAGEGDNIGPDVEGILAGTGDDTMTGNDDRNLFSGGPGDDVLTGGPGDDQLDGGSGDDRLSGGDGQDILGGEDGNDELDGGGGVDKFWGESPTGCIPLSCPSGQDLIHARDGLAEPIDCGEGTDAAEVDAVDTFQSCEYVDGAGSGPAPSAGSTPPPAAAPPSGPAAASGAGASPPGVLAIASARVDDRGRIVLRLATPGAGKLSVGATARAGRRTIDVAHASRTLRQAGALSFSLRPSRAARRALRKRRTLTASLRVDFRPASGGKSVTERRQLKLSR